jgi:hypothetical protein
MSITPWKTKKQALDAIRKLHRKHKKLRKTHEKQEQDLHLELETTAKKLTAMRFPN